MARSHTRTKSQPVDKIVMTIWCSTGENLRGAPQQLPNVQFKLSEVLESWRR